MGLNYLVDTASKIKIEKFTMEKRAVINQWNNQLLFIKKNF